MRADIQAAMNTSDVDMAVSIYIADVSSQGMKNALSEARDSARSKTDGLL